MILVLIYKMMTCSVVVVEWVEWVEWEVCLGSKLKV